MTDAASSTVMSRGAWFRDPVTLLPVTVGAGLGLGWVGVDAHIPRSRVIVDLMLVWLLIATAVFAWERTNWRRMQLLLIAAGVLLLANDLQWSSVKLLWTIGALADASWLAALVVFVLAFPAGRLRSPIERATVAVAFIAAPAGALAASLVAKGAPDAISIWPNQGASDVVLQVRAALGLGVAVVVAIVLSRRAIGLQGLARRSQWPVHVGAIAAYVVAAVRLGQLVSSPSGAITGMDTVARALTGLIPLGMLVGIAWLRLTGLQATDLIVELRRPQPLSLRDRLSHTLGDPSLQLGYRLGDGSFVDEAGSVLQLPDDPGRAVTLLRAGDEILAALVHDPALLDEPALVDSVRATTELVLENERLTAEVRSQLMQVRASRARLVTATDDERRRIERDLHDGAQQRLVTLCVALGLSARRASGAAKEELLHAQEEIEQAIAELRALARGIHPTILQEEGLNAAIASAARRAPLPVVVNGSVDGRLPPAVELAAYFVVCEALTNVAKHASASSVSVTLERTDAALSIAVSDDGVGGAVASSGGGLAGLRARVEALDGTLVARSNSGRGTTIAVMIPCGS